MGLHNSQQLKIKLKWWLCCKYFVILIKKETNNSKSTIIKQIVLVPSLWLGNIVVLIWNGKSYDQNNLCTGFLKVSKKSDLSERMTWGINNGCV